MKHLLSVLGLFLAFAAHAAEATKPNIVFILADDLGCFEVGCYGQKKSRTPNIDKLAAEGMRITQFDCGIRVPSSQTSIPTSSRRWRRS